MKKIQIFFFTFFVLFTLLFIATLTIHSLTFNKKVLSSSLNKDYLIYDHQLKKIKEMSGSYHILLGDSSLGHAIDANYLSTISKEKFINLALSDIYGFSGQYNLLKEILDNKKVKINQIIFVSSLYFIYSQTENSAFSLTSRGKFEEFFITNNKLNFIKNIFFYNARFILEKKRNDKDKLLNFININFKNDYIIQSDTFTPLAHNTNYNFEEKNKMLKMIIKLCYDNELKFIKIFGPINIDIETNMNFHIKQNEKFFKRNDIEYHEELILIPKDKFGDQIIHVHPDFKKEFTNKYFQFFKIKNII